MPTAAGGNGVHVALIEAVGVYVRWGVSCGCHCGVVTNVTDAVADDDEPLSPPSTLHACTGAACIPPLLLSLTSAMHACTGNAGAIPAFSHLRLACVHACAGGADNTHAGRGYGAGGRIWADQREGALNGRGWAQAASRAKAGWVQ